jgi:predicted TIM-barrel fold metal-dependent hydrolase
VGEQSGNIFKTISKLIQKLAGSDAMVRIASGQYPGEFDLMANADALEEAWRHVIDPMLKRHGATAVAVASSYGEGAERAFLDSPKAEWLWEYAVANDLLVHIHPPMLAIGHEVLMQYRLNEAIGRPFDSTVTCSRMIYSGVFDKYPKLKALIVHMGGDLASILGRLDFNWHLNYNGIENPPVNKVDKSKRKFSDYFKANILSTPWASTPSG